VSEHKVLLGIQNCYFNDANGCVICGGRYESGGVETGFARMDGPNGEGPGGKVKDHVCPWCMAVGPAKWKDILLEKARECRERAKTAQQKALDDAARYESLANDTFLMPTEDEEKAILEIAIPLGATAEDHQLPYQQQGIREYASTHSPWCKIGT